MDQNLAQSKTSLDFHLTHQRSLILDILKETPGHLDAGMIYLEAKKRDDRISLATVYRTLDLFTKAGLVVENDLGEDHAHFEAVQGPHHYHFTCLDCSKVIEFSAAGIPQIMETIGSQQGLQVLEIHLNLRGYCPECQEKRAKNQSELFKDETDHNLSFTNTGNKIPLISLCKIVNGKSGMVSHLNGGREFMNRIAGLGFTIGAHVTVVNNEGHGPLIVSILNTHLALGRKEAELIEVQPL